VESVWTPSTPAAESVWTPSSVESVWAPSSVASVWTPSSVESVWTPSSVESVWTPSSVESVWTPSSSTVESWAPSSVPEKGNVSISTSYTNTVYVTKATTSTTTVDCGKGTMIYGGNGSVPALTPSVVLPSNMPTDLPSDWSKSVPSSILHPPPQISASGGIVTTNCANASVTYTFTYTPSGSKPKKTSSIIETPAMPTEPSNPSPPVDEVPAVPAPGSDSGDDAESSNGSNSGKGRPSHGFSSGDMDSAGSRQDVTTFGAIFTLCVVAVVACML
jgi:hypothetical protein